MYHLYQSIYLLRHVYFALHILAAEIRIFINNIRPFTLNLHSHSSGEISINCADWLCVCVCELTGTIHFVIIVQFVDYEAVMCPRGKHADFLKDVRFSFYVISSLEIQIWDIRSKYGVRFTLDETGHLRFAIYFPRFILPSRLVAVEAADSWAFEAASLTFCTNSPRFSSAYLLAS